ncbi:MAG: hypothetical protein B6241_06005 [Spirochaetaceae bacterium 4572_59]|nr:MAG: hypothetical protein B6241_06005 [Spirochaetaceae bacterium 4572_59]
MGYIKYKEKKYNLVSIKLSKSSDFNALLKEFHTLFFSGLDKKVEHIRYAILELVNNSIRAHKELDRNDPITISFSMNDNFLTILIKDAGGGFNTSDLPYDINQDVSDIDMNNSSFQDYREKHSYKRFGMGLLLTKKTFDSFKITFYGNDGKECPWEQGVSRGTIIEMRSRIENEQ